MIDISVIVLIYNSNEEDLRLTLDSVLVQKNVSYEIVLADDASDTPALEYAKSYLDSKGYKDYKISKHDKNVGTVRNVYDALGVATGRFVKLIGAGDALFLDNTLSRVVQYMKNRALILCFGKMKGYVKNGDTYEYSSVALPYDIVAFEKRDMKRIRRNILANHGWIVGASMFFSRKEFRQYLSEFVDKVIYCEDLIQTVVLLETDKVGYYRDAVVYYESSGGISTSQNQAARTRMMNDVRALKKLLIQNYKDNPLIRRGNDMFKWQLIENTRERQTRIFYGNPSYVAMLMRSLMQRHHYQVDKKGLIERRIIG